MSDKQRPPQDDDSMAHWITTSLEQTVLDGATRSRLNRGRNAALERYDRQQRRSVGGAGWRMRPALTLATVIVLTLWFSISPPDSADAGLEELMIGSAEMVLADIELLASEAELFAEDELEFYLWLEQQSDRKSWSHDAVHRSG